MLEKDVQPIYAELLQTFSVCDEILIESDLSGWSLDQRGWRSITSDQIDLLLAVLDEQRSSLSVEIAGSGFQVRRDGKQVHMVRLSRAADLMLARLSGFDLIDAVLSSPRGLTVLSGPTALETHFLQEHFLSLQSRVQTGALVVNWTGHESSTSSTASFIETNSNLASHSSKSIVMLDMSLNSRLEMALESLERGNRVVISVKSGALHGAFRSVPNDLKRRGRLDLWDTFASNLNAVVRVTRSRGKKGYFLLPEMSSFRREMDFENEHDFYLSKWKASLTSDEVHLEMNQSLLESLIKGLLNYQDAFALSPDPDDLNSKLKRAGF